ncbi:MAG TPA: VOC family protein, partial [Myxococcales bacterium]|nr:VOC family protein [Myxococcales bacterium]
RGLRRTMHKLGWALLVASSSLIAHCAGARAEPLVRGVGCIGMTVSDLDRSSEFYSRVLSFEKTAEVEQAGDAAERLTGVFALRTRTARLRLGSECIELTEYLAARGRPSPSDARSNDRSFQHIAIVVSDMDRAYARLRAARVEHTSSEPQRLPDWNPSAAGIQAFYFRDPDRHALEILRFPKGKGEARWQRSDALFLGIDHTAIVVGDTNSSLRFYREALGLRVAGTSENWGTEQEHLNAVFGAHLRITTLRSASGPGIELLEYLSPRDGRPMPADEHPNDLVHWQTTLFGDPHRVPRDRVISVDVARLPDAPLGVTSAVLARDPDGHVLEFASQERGSSAVTGEMR